MISYERIHNNRSACQAAESVAKSASDAQRSRCGSFEMYSVVDAGLMSAPALSNWIRAKSQTSQAVPIFGAKGRNQAGLGLAGNWVLREEDQPSAEFTHAGSAHLLCHASQRLIHFFTVGVSRVRL